MGNIDKPFLLKSSVGREPISVHDYRLHIFQAQECSDTYTISRHNEYYAHAEIKLPMQTGPESYKLEKPHCQATRGVGASHNGGIIHKAIPMFVLPARLPKCHTSDGSARYGH